MGLAPYNTFTFDGKSSADFGVYLTGEGVFNAPERAVEMLSIPGRNGDYALDPGLISQDGLVGSPCSPKDSQESSPIPQFKSINSSALSFLYSPTLTSINWHY